MSNLNFKQMNFKNVMLLLAFAGLGAGCSSDEIDGQGTGGGAGTRNEIQIAFSGSGESEVYTKAAIASESENQIDKLDVYLFAAAASTGPYYYMETWKEGTPYSDTDVDGSGNPKTQFKKQDAGTGWKASIYPGEIKGLPYVRLYCVANNGTNDGSDAPNITDGKFYEQDGATETLAALTRVTTDPDGVITNAAAATTETDFLKSYTLKLTNDEAAGKTDVIKTPLLMTGKGETKISGNVSKVNIDLKRVVARFDIDNTTSKSQLTIKKLAISSARKTGALWEALQGKQPAELTTEAEKTANLMAYAPVEFDKLEGANTGVTESALYAYPGNGKDESFLSIQGTYKSPVSNQEVEVSYLIPIVKTAADGTTSEYIPIQANNRYKLRITDVTQSNVYGTFEVVDWTSGGGIIIKPDNDAPMVDATQTFAPATGGTDADLPVALKDAEGQDSKTDFEVVDGKSFNMTVAATGKVRAEIGAVTKAGEAAWLTVGAPAYEEKDGVWYTTFQMTATGATGKQPLAVTFINEAASFDPALWTTINFYGPKAVPVFAVVADGFSLGNKTAAGTDGKAPTASLYKVAGSYVTFDITSIEGVTAGTLAGYDVTVEKKAGEDYVYTCKVAVNATSAADGTIEFANAADNTKKTTLTITALDPSLAFEQVAANAAVTYTAGSETPFVTTGKLSIDLDALTTGYSFKVNAPVGLTATSLACPWLTINEDKTWADADGQRYAQYTLTAVANPTNTDDVNLVFTNAMAETLATAPGLTLTLHKDYSKPKFAAGTTTASWSDFNQGLTADFTSDPTAASISMYKAIGSKITVKMTCTEAASFENATGLTVTPLADNEYQISIEDAAALASITGATTVVKAHNDGAYAADTSTDRVATLTINWVDPAITFSVTKDVNSATTQNGDAINVDYATLAGGNFEVTVSGPVGSTIDYSAIDVDSWLGAFKKPATLADDGTGKGTAIITLRDDAGSTQTPVVITVTNKVDSDNSFATKTITINKN